MKYTWYQPETTEHIASNTVIIIPTPFGGLLSATEGLKAQIIANQTSVKVLAYERPLPFRLPVLGMQYATRLQTYKRLVKKTADQLQILTRDFTKVAIFGQSAAGIESLLLTTQTSLPITHLVVTETVAMKQMPLLKAMYLYYTYQFKQERHGEAQAADSLPTKGVWSQLKTFIKSCQEVIVYSSLWRSDLALQALTDVATEKKFHDIPVTVMFATNSLIGDQLDLPKLAMTLTNLRSDLLHAKPFRVLIQPESRHSTFTDPLFTSSLLLQALNN